MGTYKKWLALLSVVLCASCGAYFNQPLLQKASRIGEYSSSTKPLLELPEAQRPVEIAVYNFSDQTGQYKPVENGSTFSTSVTQGGTTILLKALEDSGWFVPLERENLGNLSTERQIIRSTKEEYVKGLNPNEPPLPPLLYAGLMLEGGIISYDTNIITGGIGARYFGIGGSAKYRQDRITVYLRAVSTSNGEILKTVYVSKTILSQALDASFFRFVKFQRLLEAETGITQNEPVQLAVKDAIEKAVRDLIIEGIKEGYWSSVNGYDADVALVASYLDEKDESADIRLYDREFAKRDYKNSISFSVGGTLPLDDYSSQNLGILGRLTYNHSFTDTFGLDISGSLFEVNNDPQYSNFFGSVDTNLHINILPNDNLSPFIYGGPGFLVDAVAPKQDSLRLQDFEFKLQYGIGLKYFVSPRIDLMAYAEHNLLFTDELDKVVNGRQDDMYFNFGVGLSYHFNFRKKAIREQNQDAIESLETN